MTETKHTPGPWIFREFYGEPEENEKARALGLKPVAAVLNDGSRLIMAAETRICAVDMQTRAKRGQAHKTDCAERDANARLIAAAPDMLAALKWIESIATVNYEQDEKLRSDGARTLKRIFDHAATAIAAATGEQQ